MATTETPKPRRLPPRALSRLHRFREWLIELLLFGCGLFSVVVTVGIAVVVFYGSADFFTTDDTRVMSAGEVWDRVVYFFTGTEWTPAFEPARFGILPLVLGTLTVTAIAALIALPVGLCTAIYLSEYARPQVRSVAKPALELLAGIPTVVYGFFAMKTVTPLLGLFIPGLGATYNQLSGGIVVGIMIIPMVASLSEDALRAVPRALRDGAYALGANKVETSLQVVVPSALSGITASFLLALSRAIGETMAVTLAVGGEAKLTLDPREGFATMTSFIATIAGGDKDHASSAYKSLFAVAAVLFLSTLAMNVVAQAITRRYRQVYQ